MVRLHHEIWVASGLGQALALPSQLVRCFVLGSGGVKHPQPPKYRKKLGGLAGRLTEFPRPSVNPSYLRRCKTSGGDQGHAEGKLQAKLLLEAFGAFWCGLEQLEPLAKVIDCFRVC